MKKLLATFILFTLTQISFAGVIFNMSKSSVMQVTYTVFAFNGGGGSSKYFDPVQVTINPKTRNNVNYVVIPQPVSEERFDYVGVSIDKVVIQNGTTSNVHEDVCERYSKFVANQAMFLDDSVAPSMLICTQGTVS